MIKAIKLLKSVKYQHCNAKGLQLLVYIRQRKHEARYSRLDSSFEISYSTVGCTCYLLNEVESK